MFFWILLMHWWELYYKTAVALVNDNRSVWNELIEATKVLKLSFKTLREGEFEIALYTLWQLHKNKEDREMSFVLEYLAYRRRK